VNLPIDLAIEQYALEHTSPFEGPLAAAADWTATEMSNSQMMAGVPEARLLQLLVRLSGARNVLEIGTFTGVGTLSIAAALPDGGRVTTLELDPKHAEIAERHIAASPYGERIEQIVGDARETLPQLPGPFDLVWIDAWKNDYPLYLREVVPKLSPGGVIAADNVLRGGRVADPAANDAGTVGTREFNDLVQADPQLDNVLLTVGDGVMLAWRRN
jgi:caffeoyl-CoA O-methyltransferase